MERLRALIGLSRCVAITLVGALPALTGCASTTKQLETVQQSLYQMVENEPPKPATEMACGWQNRLSALPDPTKSGMKIQGIAGQVFLFTQEYQAAEVVGDLTITVHDATPRPQNMPAKQPEIWHFAKDTLSKMQASDDRFGRSIVLFLPWPEHWQDVNTLYIQARYDQEGHHTLYAQPTTLTMDYSSPGSTPVDTANRVPAVPDPKILLEQARMQSRQQPGMGMAQAQPNMMLPQQGQIPAQSGMGMAQAQPNMMLPQQGQAPIQPGGPGMATPLTVQHQVVPVVGYQPPPQGVQPKLTTQAYALPMQPGPQGGQQPQGQLLPPRITQPSIMAPAVTPDVLSPSPGIAPEELFIPR